MTRPQNTPTPEKQDLPPIRRPFLFYTTVVVAFGLLGAAVLALLA